MPAHNPQTIPGTRRQTVKTVSGSAVERAYVYLPGHVWRLLHEAAHTSGTSVSQVIQSFATSGTANSKDNNDSYERNPA